MAQSPETPGRPRCGTIETTKIQCSRTATKRLSSSKGASGQTKSKIPKLHTSFDRKIDQREKLSFTIPPTEAGDGDPGPSNQGQFDPWIPPNNPNPDKRSASTPRQDKGKAVDGGGNYQPPPPPPSNIGGDPDPDTSNDDDNEGKGGNHGTGRRGGRPERNARRSLVPRDSSPRTRGIIEFLQQLSTPNRSIKNASEPPYFF